MCLVQATRNDRSFVITSALNNAVHFLHQSQDGTPATGFKPYLKASQLNRPSAPAVRVLFFVCLNRGAKRAPLSRRPAHVSHSLAARLLPGFGGSVFGCRDTGAAAAPQVDTALLASWASFDFDVTIQLTGDIALVGRIDGRRRY